jgi:hypothetical protein
LIRSHGLYLFTAFYLTCLLCVLWAPGVSAQTPAAQPVKTGILWQVPDWLIPDMTLSHPRVMYTAESLAEAKSKLAANVAWAMIVYDAAVNNANTFTMTPEEIRSYMPPQYSYFKYTDTMIPCPDGSPMTASWANPGKVTCGRAVYPDAEHPDDGRGWRDGSGQVHYFVARWNGFVIEQLTGRLPSLSMAYALSGEERYAESAAAILDAIATIYPTAVEGPLDYPGLRPGVEGGRLERPYFQTARVLLNYVNAVDLIWSSDILDQQSPTNPELTMRENIIYNMLLNGADYCYREANRAGFVDSLNNGTADYNKAILAVGSLLGIDRYVEWAVNGPTSLQTMISNNLDRDGLYYETTAGYTNVVRNLYLQIADMMYNLRTEKYPQGINYYDDERFAALYADSRERLFVAGRSPSYGDTDPDRVTTVGRPMDETAARQLLQFALRATDPEAKARYWELVAEGTRGYPIMSAQNEWGLFNVKDMPLALKAPERTMATTEVLGGKGITLLRSGEDRGAMMRYGTTLAHGQKDELGLLLYTHGREMSFDPGYAMAHYRVGWTHQTVSHLTTVVNETSQQGSGGSLYFTTSAPGLAVTEAHDEGAYAHIGVDTYRRLIALIDASPTHSYVLDIFRVKGGQVRDYSFHSWANTFSTEGMELSAPRAGSVAATNYTWHNVIGVDEKVIPHRNQAFGWVAPPGNGYGFLGYPSYAAPSEQWSAIWDNGDRKLKLMMLPDERREVIVADAPSPMGNTKYLLARERGSEPSQFVSVIDMTNRQFQVASFTELQVTASQSGDFAPVAVAVRLADAAPEVSDIVLSSLTGSFTAQDGAYTYATDAEFAAVRRAGAAMESAHVVKGTFLNTDEWQITGFPTEYDGTILEVDYQNGSILVESVDPLSARLEGLYILVDAPEYSHNSPYQIVKVEAEGANTRIYLSPGTLELGKGYLPQAPYGKRLPNSTPLPYANIAYRSTPNDYFDGKLVVNERGAAAQIEMVERGAVLVVDDVTGFAQGDSLTVYDIKAGDAFSIPVAIHFTKVDDLAFHLKGPQPVLLSLSDKDDAYVYVENEAGEFTLAQWEMREGKRWFVITPGRVILERAGRISGESALAISDDRMVPIQVSALEFGTEEPISGATLTATISGQSVPLAETAAGVYALSSPQGIQKGRHDLVISAQKPGIIIGSHTMELEANATWQLQVPQWVGVELGGSAGFLVSLTGIDAAQVQVQAYADGKALQVVPQGNDQFEVHVPAVTTEQKVQVVAQRIGGFAQQAVTTVQPAGGQVIPLHPVLYAKAGQELVIEVKFTASDGSLLKGAAIPYSMAFVGFLSSDEFADPDGDGIATATMTHLAPGTHTLTLWADGCDPVDIQLIVEP